MKLKDLTAKSDDQANDLHFNVAVYSDDRDYTFVVITAYISRIATGGVAFATY